MPELLPTYGRFANWPAAGIGRRGSLSLYCPPAYLSGCSQLVWHDGEPALIRNYDYAPWLCEDALLLTAWNGRRVMAMSDCAWGVLDGLNEDGLAVSLSFGGRRASALVLARPCCCAMSWNSAPPFRRPPGRFPVSPCIWLIT